jgi:hypothetical protein
MPGLFAPITAPANRQATSGLVALAAAFTDAPDGWEGGFGFDPEACEGGLTFAIECGQTASKDASTNPDSVLYAPAALIAVDACTTMNEHDGTGRARRLLLALESELLEALLWTGDATGDDVAGEARPHLADGRAVELAAGAAVGIGVAFALMDQALTGCLHGVAGMVHVTPYTLAVAAAADLVDRDGNRWVTPNGHTVVAGAGYTGGGPRPAVGGALPAAPDLLAAVPANQWMYGTGPVFYLLGSTDTRSAVDRAVNTVTAMSERPGAAFYSPCCQFAAQIDLTPT